jgi:hypothetical protein
MDTVESSTGSSEPLTVSKIVPRARAEQGRADTPFAVPAIAVTPGPAHHYSDGVIVPGRCAWCGLTFSEHERR